MLMDAAFGNWLAGFIDGEGCFAINIATPHGTKHYRCMFTLRIRLDDAAIIEQIHQTVGFGVVFTAKGKLPTHPSIGWAVHKRKDCVALSRLLSEYPLRAKKARDLAIWRLALAEQCGAKDRVRMQEYKDALTTVRRYQGGEVELPEVADPPQLRLLSSH